MTAPTPNAALAYRVLDHIDAHPEQWDQGSYLRTAECGTVGCFAGWACLLSGEAPKVPCDTIWLASSVRVPDRAEQLLGASRYIDEVGTEGDLFSEYNTREDLGRLVAEIFGPRPKPVAEAPWSPLDDSIADDVIAALEQRAADADRSWYECAHRADYASAAEHERNCPFHLGEVDEHGLPVDDLPPNAGTAS